MCDVTYESNFTFFPNSFPALFIKSSVLPPTDFWCHLYHTLNFSMYLIYISSISLVYFLFRWAVPHYFMYKGFVVCFKEKAMAPHFSTLAWKIPWTEEPGRLQSMGCDWVTSLSFFTFMHWRRKWQPTPVFFPGESQGRQSLVGCRLWGHRVGHDWSNLAAAIS